MAMTIILQDSSGNQEKILEVSVRAEEWEQDCYQVGCSVAKEVAIRVLESMEEQLFGDHPKGWRVKGHRSRQVAALFGEMTVRRRLYQDEDGKYHFLLDEHLNWRPYQKAANAPRQD